MDNICNVSCQYIAKTIKQKIINGMVWYFHLYSGLKYLAFSYFVPVKKLQINISKPNIMMKKIVKGSAGKLGCPYTSNTNKTSKEMPIKYIKFIPIFFAKSFVWSINTSFLLIIIVVIMILIPSTAYSVASPLAVLKAFRINGLTARPKACVANLFPTKLPTKPIPIC